MRTAPEDLTARARIRDAAVAVFAREGLHRASIRAIAQEAEVSPALVIHHFGSKEGLRDACDEWVVDSFMSPKHELIDAPPSTLADRIRTALTELPHYRVQMDYLTRILMEDSNHAQRLVDHLFRESCSVLSEQEKSGVVRPQSDPAMTAALITIFGLAPLLMRRHLAHALGGEDLTPDMLQRMTLPMLELFTHGLYADSRYLDATRAALAAGESRDDHTDDDDQKGDADVTRD